MASERAHAQLAHSTLSGRFQRVYIRRKVRGSGGADGVLMDLTREQLAKFLPDPRTIKQFEKLLGLVTELEPDTLNMLSLLAGGADSKANDALSQLTRMADALERMPPAQRDNVTSTDYIDFGTGPHVTKPRRVGWNDGDGTIDVGMGYDGVTQQVGLETYYRIKASATISNGQVVMFDGSVGASGVLKGKPSTGLTSGQLVMGVATMDIPNNEFGYVTAFGLVRGINTTGASVGEAWADGDLLYYNPSYVGGLTKTIPTAPIPKVICAAVVNAGSGGSGSLFVRTTFIPQLSNLSDVHAPAPTSGNTVIYDSSSSRWVAANLTAGANIAITGGSGSISVATTGASGSFTAGANTVTVSNGIITSIV